LIGNLGGVNQLIIGVIGFFIYPWAHFNFNIKAIEKLYLAKTRNASIFLKKQSKNLLALKHALPDELRGSSVETEARFHHPIKVSLTDIVWLYMCK